MQEREYMHVDSLRDIYDFLQSVMCRIKVKSIGRLYVIDDEFFGGINPPSVYRVTGRRQQFSTKEHLFLPRRIFSGEHRYPRKTGHHRVNVIARDVLSLANTGCPGPAPIHHT